MNVADRLTFPLPMVVLTRSGVQVAISAVIHDQGVALGVLVHFSPSTLAAGDVLALSALSLPDAVFLRRLIAVFY